MPTQICPNGHSVEVVDAFCKTCGVAMERRSLGNDAPKQFSTEPKPISRTSRRVRWIATSIVMGLATLVFWGAVLYGVVETATPDKEVYIIPPLSSSTTWVRNCRENLEWAVSEMVLDPQGGRDKVEKELGDNGFLTKKAISLHDRYVDRVGDEGITGVSRSTRGYIHIWCVDESYGR